MKHLHIFGKEGNSELADDTERWLLHSGSCLKRHTFVHKCVRETLRENVTLGGGKKIIFAPFIVLFG